ncbi:MAG TPA: hypothetical protein VKH63_21460 [Candidatus Acidoferrum sp.]|nr:hypothetical protein [Candidatus Acidoferrum sp.]
MDDGARHFSAVLIAFLFGVAALVPTCSFTENLQSTAIHEVRTSSTTVQFVFIPGLFFAAGALLSGLAIWRAGLLPSGISCSWLRIAGGTLFAIFVYPAAFAATVLAVMILFFTASPDSSLAAAHPTLKFLFGFVVFGGIVWFVVVVTAVFLALAFAFATRFWPRRVFLSAVTLAALAVVGDILAAIIQEKLKFPAIPSMRYVENEPLALLLGFAWGLPLIVFIGEPLLAAVIGHWLYLAAMEYADSSA